MRKQSLIAGIIAIILTISGAFAFIIFNSNDKVSEELIEISDDITILGSLEIAACSYWEEIAYKFPEYRIGNIGLFTNNTGNYTMDLGKVVVSGHIRNVNWTEKGILYESKIESCNWYTVIFEDNKVILSIKNPLEVEIKNIIINHDLGEEIINSILPREVREFSWIYSECDEIRPTFTIQIKSEDFMNNTNKLYESKEGVFVYAVETIWPSAEDCPYSANIAVDIDTTADYLSFSTGWSCMINESFEITATVENSGDLTAENIKCTIYLPPELSTAEKLTKYIPKINPASEENITWTVTAEKGGNPMFMINAFMENDSSSNYGFLSVITYDHDINVSTDVSKIEANGDLYKINLTVKNIGEMQDNISFYYHIDLVTSSGNSSYGSVVPDNMTFNIYDGSCKIYVNDKVTIAENGTKTLLLEINVDSNVLSGSIEIYATSETDPLAQDSVVINILNDFN